MHQRYNVNQYVVNNVLTWIETGAIAVPEIQRPFVWSTVKVRNLIDSLYRGYPIGYIITWKNPKMRMKDSISSEGRKILIDGQQRVMALRASVLGKKIVDKTYKKKRIYIAFNPIEERFETLTPAIKNNNAWIPDISAVVSNEENFIEVVNNYCDKNPGVDQKLIAKNISRLVAIKNKQIGFIDLESDLDIEAVTNIFVRINAEGVPLGQADFAMSKIASYEADDNLGVNLRKCIDYFCHLNQNPNFYSHISENDKEFADTLYLNKISWLKDVNDTLYNPSYSDVLRVAFIKEFKRGKLADLVSLLSGRNFETRKFEEEIMVESFRKLQKGVLDFVNKTHFERFVMIVKSAGFINPKMIGSQAALNFAYVVYLILRDQGMDDNLIEKYVQRWFVLSMLTKRYSGSPETQFDDDVKNINKKGVKECLRIMESSQLSDTFWNIELVDEMETSSINSPYFNVFVASQVKDNIKGFLSSDITVHNMAMHRGDMHHIFPKEYLKTKYNSRKDYNQIANYVYAQSEINIKIGKKSPEEYFEEIANQCKGGELKYGNINSLELLKKNLKEHCIPEAVFEMNIENYFEFLEKRRKLMAQRIKNYYQGFVSSENGETKESPEKLIAGGENNEAEFKSSLRWDYKEERINKKLEIVILKSLSAFANAEGGKLVIGVDDNGEILGLENDYLSLEGDRDKFELHLRNIINNTFGKNFAASGIAIEFYQAEGKEICVIDVLRWGSPLYLEVTDNNGQKSKKFYVRSGNSSQELELDEISEYINSRF